MLMRSFRTESPTPDRFRDASRAIADLRRGAAIIVRTGDSGLGLAAVEAVEAAGLETVREWAGPARPGLLRPEGLAAGSGDPDATLADWQNEPAAQWHDVPEGALTPQALRHLADPAHLDLFEDRRPGRSDPVPAGATGAIRLAKLGRLLPTMIATPVTATQMRLAAAAGTMVADEADILALHGAGARLVRVGETRVPLQEAPDARLVAFRNPDSGTEHIAIVIGRPEGDADGPAPLVRLHSECFTGDVLGSLRCDCGPQLQAALRRMTEEGAGIVLYLAQEGRGIGLLNKLRSYVLQDAGRDTLDANAALGFAADERDFAIAAAMLRDLEIRRCRLLTNNPAKLAGLVAGGIAVTRASLLIAPNGTNDAYLATKASRFGHLLDPA